MSEHRASFCDLCEAARLTHLARWRQDQGDYVLAAAWLQRAVALKQLAESVEPLEVAEDFYNLGIMYLAMDDDFNAERFLLKALQRQAKALGARHADTVATVTALRHLYCLQDEYAFVQAPNLFDLDLLESVPLLAPERRRPRHAS